MRYPPMSDSNSIRIKRLLRIATEVLIIVAAGIWVTSRAQLRRKANAHAGNVTPDQSAEARALDEVLLAE